MFSNGNGNSRGGGDATAQKKRNSGFQPLSSVLQNFTLDDKGGRISQEFQDFGYRLSVELGDMDHKSLYIKMAKTTDRKILEEARSFVVDSNARSKARLFMWKVSELKKLAKEKAAK
ncbi:MAG TPA: hypothetical protein VFG51_01335 [Candidatus Saccharimonadia bacterium]|nr:hypothetical protein [Candidatus Saccharimonadia bacterium]